MATDIVAENAITTGRTNYTAVDIAGNGDLDNLGFPRQISVNVGETVQFCVDGPAVDIDIYRVGWYGGDGFRLVASITNNPTTQPEAQTIANSNGATSCTNWSVTASWAVPAGATSGLYVALIRTPPPDGPNGSYMTFVVRDDAATVDIIYKTSDSTWGAAYNHYGSPNDLNGKNIYGDGVGVGNITQRSLAVSYHRPLLTRGAVGQTYWQNAEQPLIRFLERNGYSVKYVTCLDLDQDPTLLDTGTIFLSSGHDEYWSSPMRTTVETWRDNSAGRSIFLSANEVFWRVRYELNGDEPIMWCHKDTMPGPDGHVAGEPLDPVTWTGTWRDQRWPENEPEWFLTGTDFRMNGIRDENALIISNPYGGHKVWGGSVLVDQDLTLIRVVGFEADSMRPQQPVDSVAVLAAYTINIDGWYADDNGQTYSNNGDLTWGIVSQRYAGGGVTVGFGTVQWAWTLDDVHLRGTGTEVDVNAQQFTVNLLRDFGADPGTLMAGVTLQPVSSLDEYGLDPNGPAPEAQWLDSEGNGYQLYRLDTGGLVSLSTLGG